MNNFIKLFFIYSLSLFVLTNLFIFSVDPYDKFGINVFNVKTKAVSGSRENKFNMVENSKKEYKAFILGSSSAHRYDTNNIKSRLELEAFNYSVQHATIDDYLAITKHILTKSKPRYIFLQIDPYALNLNFKTDTRFYTSPLKNYLSNVELNYFKNDLFYNNYLTLDALRDSFKVLWNNAFGVILHEYLDDGNYKKEEDITGPVRLTQFESGPYELSSKRVTYLKEIKELCQKNDIKLVVFSAPRSLEHLERKMASPELEKSYEIFKKALYDIFPDFIDFETLEFAKDFNSTIYFRDSSHPTKELSSIVLNKILDTL